MVIEPRAPVIDELTRHRHTPQLFVPITGQIMGVVAASQHDDDSKPDPHRIVMVPVSPGEVLEVAPGTWHTLPFAFVTNVLCLSVMHREDLDSYHDVRDLAAEGWIGVLEWLD
jgi:ureidoglycolate hydrolase